MIDSKKVFLDTAPIIYFLDEDVNFGTAVRKILEEAMEAGCQFATSVITCEEYLVYPYKTHNIEKIDVFFEFVLDCNIPLYTIDVDTAKKAASIRADYPGFKAMDALQLASAYIHGCDLFLTNDKQLRQFRDIHCITVDEWRKQK